MIPPAMVGAGMDTPVDVQSWSGVTIDIGCPGVGLNPEPAKAPLAGGTKSLGPDPKPGACDRGHGPITVEDVVTLPEGLTPLAAALTPEEIVLAP